MIMGVAILSCDRFKGGCLRKVLRDLRLTSLGGGTFVWIKGVDFIITRANLKEHHKGMT